PLLVGSPFARLIAFRFGGSPEANRIDPAIRLMAGYIDRAEGVAARSVPGHPPVSYAFFDCADDLGRYGCINVPLFGCGILVCRHRSCAPTLVFRGRARL